MKITKKQLPELLGGAIIALGLMLGSPQLLADKFKSGKDNKGNIVTAIVSAPVVPNGVVAGEPTEINILLNAPLVDDEVAFDSENFGHQIPAGGWMDVTLSGGFEHNLASPVLTGASFIITTGPQNPLLPPPGGCVACGNWGITDDGMGTITVIPNGGNGANGLEGQRAKEVGFKVIHIRPSKPRDFNTSPYINGPAGSVGTVSVTIYKADGSIHEWGYGDIVIPASVGPQIHLTAGPVRDDASVNSNTNFQHVSPNTTLTETMLPGPGEFAEGGPYAPMFAMFAALEDQTGSFIPFDGITGVTVEPDGGEPWKAALMQAGDQIGTVVMSGPTESSRGTIGENLNATTQGSNGSTLFVPVQVGNEPGLYKVSVTLMGGGSATNTIVVEKK